MGAMADHVLATLALMTAPINLLALTAGITAGLLFGRIATLAGLSRASVLAVLFPVAALLDPTAGLILLGAGWAAALAGTVPAHVAGRAVLTAAAMAMITALLIGPLAVFLAKLSGSERLAWLVAGAGGAVVLASWQNHRAWLGSLVLMLAGIALEFGPMPPLDTAKTSPRAVLLGLLVLGPALALLVRPQLWSTARRMDPGLKKAATVLPLLLFAVPVTLAAALVTLALGEHGLAAGPAWLTQRPRLAQGFVLAMLAGGLVALVIAAIAQRLPRFDRVPWPEGAALVRTAALCAVLLAAGVLLRIGVESPELVYAAAATVAGAVLAWIKWSPAQLVVGLVLGEAMRGVLPQALKTGIPDTRVGLLFALAAISIAIAAVWPWLARAPRACSSTADTPQT